jgi:UDP-N-acetyl-D-mannosaminuronic acid dehydrogenase
MPPQTIQSICILGLGYIGLPTAAMFANSGYNVHGVDVNEAIVETLNNGDIHIHEPGLKTLVQAAFKSGNLQVGQEPIEADAFIIAVPTPFKEEMATYQPEDGGEPIEYKQADMRYVRSATEAIVPSLRPGNLVVLESTSPPKTTTDLVQPLLEESGLNVGEDVYLAYSPERVLPGKILSELVHNARVIGGVNDASAERGRELYASFVEGEIYLTDATTAEMVKLMENTYRDVNIALANEFSRLAEPLSFDVWEAIDLANNHPRVDILNPGIGVGGHCIGVDPWFLVEAAPETTPLIRQARRVNDAQPEHVIKLVEEALDGSVAGKRIAALGLTYKPDVDDLRESPAVKIVRLLLKAGAYVKAYDPNLNENNLGDLPIVYSLKTGLRDVDVILLLVAHHQFLSLAPETVSDQTSARLLIDMVHSRNGSMATWEDEFHYVCLGLGENDRILETFVDKYR